MSLGALTNITIMRLISRSTSMSPMFTNIGKLSVQSSLFSYHFSTIIYSRFDIILKDSVFSNSIQQNNGTEYCIRRANDPIPQFNLSFPLTLSQICQQSNVSTYLLIDNCRFEKIAGVLNGKEGLTKGFYIEIRCSLFTQITGTVLGPTLSCKSITFYHNIINDCEEDPTVKGSMLSFTTQDPFLMENCALYQNKYDNLMKNQENQSTFMIQNTNISNNEQLTDASSFFNFQLSHMFMLRFSQLSSMNYKNLIVFNNNTMTTSITNNNFIDITEYLFNTNDKFGLEITDSYFKNVKKIINTAQTPIGGLFNVNLKNCVVFDELSSLTGYGGSEDQFGKINGATKDIKFIDNNTCSTFSYTPTPSIIPTPSFTKSSRFTKSNLFSLTHKFTKTQTYTESKKFTVSANFTKSPTRSPTYDRSITPVATPTQSSKFTKSNLFSPTKNFTPSNTFTPTPTEDFTVSENFTMSATPSKSMTAFQTPSRTKPVPSVAPKQTPSQSPRKTPGQTPPPTSTPTPSHSPTATPNLEMIIGISIPVVLVCIALPFILYKLCRMLMDCCENDRYDQGIQIAINSDSESSSQTDRKNAMWKGDLRMIDEDDYSGNGFFDDELPINRQDRAHPELLDDSISFSSSSHLSD